MKHSIRGSLTMADGSDVVSTINQYSLWRLITGQSKSEDDIDIFTFEAWINTEADKTALFNELKPYVDQYGEVIDWHECTHDEVNTQPCMIAEEYRR